VKVATSARNYPSSCDVISKLISSVKREEFDKTVFHKFRNEIVESVKLSGLMK